MKSLEFSRHALTAGIAGALLAGCGSAQPPIGAPGAMPQASALAARITSTNYKVIYSFGAVPDGSYPVASLLDVSGTLYGTTQAAGSRYCGAVFSITPNGAENVLHSFGRCQNPSSAAANASPRTSIHLLRSPATTSPTRWTAAWWW